MEVIVFIGIRDPEKRKNLVICLTISLIIILAAFSWYRNAYSYIPGETLFRLSFTEYYSDRVVTIKVEYGMLSIDTRTIPSLTGTTEYYELTEEQTKELSDYIVMNKRFFLSLDGSSNTGQTKQSSKESQYIEVPYKYEIRVRFRELDRTVTAYEYNTTPRITAIRNHILGMTKGIWEENSSQ